MTSTTTRSFYPRRQVSSRAGRQSCHKGPLAGVFMSFTGKGGTGMLRIRKAQMTGPLAYVMKRFSRKMFGEVAEPLEVLWHNKRVLKDTMAIGRKVQKWDT